MSGLHRGCLRAQGARRFAKGLRSRFSRQAGFSALPIRLRCCRAKAVGNHPRSNAIYFELPKSFMCCGLLAALSWSSSMPSNLPRLCGANSTEIVQVPPFAAIVSHVLALTLNGGVAAGAVVNEIGAGLVLTSVML